jgi:hypothetical protein
MAKRRRSGGGSRRKTKVSTSRYKESYESRDRGGVSRRSVIDFRAASEKTGRDLKFFDPNEGVNRFNIIPYEIKTKAHPEVANGNMEIGDLDYKMDLWVHRRVGEGDADFICLKRTYGKACPLCEEAKRFQDNGQKKEYDALKASRRVFYNVQPIKRGEPSEDLFLFAVSHYLFDKELIEEASELANGEGIVPFSDIEDGSVVKFRAVQDSWGGNEYFRFKSFDFVEREIELDDSLIDQAVSFDEFLVPSTAEEMEKALFGAGDEDEEEEEKPRSRRAAKKVDDDEDEDEDEEEEEAPKSRSRRKSKVEDDDDDDDEDDEEEIDEEEVDEDEDEEEEEEPEPEPKKTRAKSSRSAKSTTSKKSTASKTASKKKASAKNGGFDCPSGYRFGVDTDKYEECEECPVWEACDEAKEKGER